MDRAAELGSYVQVVGVAMGMLMRFYKSRDEVGEAEMEEAAGIARSMNRELIDDEKYEWLRRDLRILVDSYWDTLRDRKNRGRFDEIVRGALR